MKSLVFLLFFTPAFADKHVETPKEKDIRKLLVLTGADKMGEQVVKQVIETFRSSMPNVPPGTWMEVQQEVHPPDLAEKIVPLYDKELSAQEVKDILRFYESATGKKLIRVMPVISQASAEVSQEWSRAVGEQVLAALKKKGVGKK